MALTENGEKKKGVTAKIFPTFLALITPDYKSHGQKIDGQKKMTAKKKHGVCVVLDFHGQKSESNVISRPKKLSITPYASARAHTGAHSVKSRNARYAGALNRKRHTHTEGLPMRSYMMRSYRRERFTAKNTRKYLDA